MSTRTVTFTISCEIPDEDVVTDVSVLSAEAPQFAVDQLERFFPGFDWFAAQCPQGPNVCGGRPVCGAVSPSGDYRCDLAADHPVATGHAVRHPSGVGFTIGWSAR